MQCFCCNHESQRSPSPGATAWVLLSPCWLPITEFILILRIFVLCDVFRMQNSPHKVIDGGSGSGSGGGIGAVAAVGGRQRVENEISGGVTVISHMDDVGDWETYVAVENSS